MEEVMSAHQSAETMETFEATETPIETTATEEAPVTTQETPSAPEGIRVKYNKEERVIGLDEAPTWIQKGLNYDKVQERAAALEQQAKNLERVAKLNNFESVDEYVAWLDEFEEQQRIQAEAERLGVPEDFIRKELQPLQNELNELRKAKEQLRFQEVKMQIDADLKATREKYPDFGTYEKAVFDLVQEHGYSFEAAYKLASYDDVKTNVAKQAESETIRKLRDNAESSTGALGADSPEQTGGYTSLSKEERRALRERIKRGS